MIDKRALFASLEISYRLISIRLSVLIIVLFLNNSAYGQDKVELGFMVGTSSYMGDLNPVNPVYQPNPSAAILGRYVFSDRIVFKGTLLGTSLRGSYPSDNVWYPRTDGVNYLPDSIPEYSFYRPLVVDLSGQVEINFLPYDHPYLTTTNFTPYIALGLGTTIYKRFSDSSSDESFKQVFVLSLPLSLGIKYKINQYMRLGVDWTFRKVFASDLDQPEANTPITPADPFGYNSSSLVINNDWISTIGVSLTFNMLRPNVGCDAGYKNDLKR